MINDNWKANGILEIIRQGMEDKISLCHCYIYGVFNGELISDSFISKRYNRARKDTEKDNKVNQKSEMASAHGEIK